MMALKDAFTVEKHLWHQRLSTLTLLLFFSDSVARIYAPTTCAAAFIQILFWDLPAPLCCITVAYRSNWSNKGEQMTLGLVNPKNRG